MSNRDEFSPPDKETLAKRARQLCSNPDCQSSTSGPHTRPDRAINTGVAAHICAAAPGGKRYDSDMTPEERGRIGNAIWLCQTCAKLVDSDEQEYTVELLRRWKEEHERSLAQDLKGSRQNIKDVTEIARKLDRKIEGIAEDIAIVSHKLTAKV